MARPRGDWLVARPPDHLGGPGGLVLDRSMAADRSDLVAAVNDSLDHLAPFMPWARSPATDAATAAFLADGEAGWAAGTLFQYVLRPEAGGPVIGCTALHNRLGPGGLEIGYWVRSGWLRQGRATAAAAALTDAGFALPGVERMEIHTDEANLVSARIPVVLGYRLDRVVPWVPLSPAGTDRLQVWVRHR